MKLAVLTVGRGGCAWADEAVADYTKRLRRHLKVEELSVKVERFHGDVEAVKRAEGERILARLGARDRVIALDERGVDHDTRQFTALLKKARLGGVHRLVFVLGGAYGLSRAVRERADEVVRLSSMVLNHEVARVVLVEQVYRGMTLILGIPYHH